ncbi:MAG: hypothetical protein WBF53_14490 [Litorimonas sp.]
MELDADTGLPRFNMPFELGLFLGAKRYGEGRQKRKRLAIFDQERFRYQKSLSDISGQDIQSHNGEIAKIIKCTRDWLDSHRDKRKPRLPGARHISKSYEAYKAVLPAICDENKLHHSELSYNDMWEMMTEWLVAEAS